MRAIGISEGRRLVPKGGAASPLDDSAMTAGTLLVAAKPPEPGRRSVGDERHVADSRTGAGMDTTDGLLILCILLSFFGALASPWRWAFLPFPILAVLLGKKLDDDQPPTYDMRGLGLVAGIFIAVITIIVWLIGRWIRHRVRNP
jgi:hypothetical protein